MAENLNKLESLMEEFLLLYKFVNKDMISEKLHLELNSNQLIEIYEKTNGENSTRDISNSIKNKCSHVKIANLWNKWARAGIVVPVGKKGRYKAAFDLSEYGMSSIDEESEE